MTEEIKASISAYDLAEDPKSFKLILNAGEQFLKTFPNGVRTQDDLKLGIVLVKRLVSISYICSTKEYENDHKLYREILQKKIKVFKRCIPQEYADLRGVTELLVGMKENELE